MVAVIFTVVTVHTIPVKCPTGDSESFMLGPVFLVTSASL